MKMISLLLAGLAASGSAMAGDCENNFKALGDPRNGTQFSTSAIVSQVSVGSALGQLRTIATADGFTVLNEDGDARQGSLTIEQSKGVREPFLIYFTATGQGAASEIAIRTRMNRGVTAKPEDIRMGMCGMIARLKPGAEGEAIANAARAAAPATKVIDIKARTLAREMDAEVRNRSPELVSARYKGKVYRIDGEIDEPLENEGTLEIWFDVFNEGNSLMAPEAGSEISRTQVICRLAKDQIEEGSLLKAGDMAKLTGTVSRYIEGAPRRLVLEDCKFR